MTGLVVTLAMLSSDMSTFLAARSLQMKESRNAVCHHSDRYMGGGGGGGGLPMNKVLGFKVHHSFDHVSGGNDTKLIRSTQNGPTCNYYQSWAHMRHQITITMDPPKSNE